MKVNGYDVPENLFYNKEHIWVQIENPPQIRVGITDYAQKMLKEITFLYLPKKGMTVNQLEAFGTVESVKALSELYSPFSGKIVQVNQKLRKRPRIINEDCYRNGWIIIIHPTQFQKEREKLITPEQYAIYIKELIQIDEELLIYRWKESEER